MKINIRISEIYIPVHVAILCGLSKHYDLEQILEIITSTNKENPFIARVNESNLPKLKECCKFEIIEEATKQISTSESHNKPEPKEWEMRSNNGVYVAKFTSSELKHFIETAVINNKDITNFTITRIF